MSVQSLHVGSAFPPAISQSIRTNGVNSINGGVNGVNGVGYNHNPNNQTYNSASLNGSVGSGLTVYPPGLVASISVDYAQCFNVPFTNIPGPPREDIMYCTPGAVDRWTHPEGSPPDAPASALPVHKKAVDDLRAICRQHSDDIYCNVTVLESQGRTSSMSGRKQRGMVATVIMSGQEHSVVKMRERILQKAAIMLKSDSVDLEAERLLDSEGRVFDYVRNQLIKISEMTGADMFILKMHVDTLAKGFDPRKDCSQKEKVRVAIYGSTDVVEHAKTRLLIYIDQLLGLQVDSFFIDLSLHPLTCGRSRKFVKRVESVTATAIYFPPLFPEIYGAGPEKCRRNADEIFISGRSVDDIQQAKKMLIDQACMLRVSAKTLKLAELKHDYLILERLDDIRKIMLEHGTFVYFNRLGFPSSEIQIRGVDIVNVDRTLKAIAGLCSQFYSAQWWILGDPHVSFGKQLPTAKDIRNFLVEISAHSGAEVIFGKHVFAIHGLDDAVKSAIVRLSRIPFIHACPHQLQCKIELHNEHKEFVSGKKNGKLNKIMGTANVQIAFQDFNEYDFMIDISASNYEYVMHGVDLVEQELPASVSFHVPDQYHKRIIGVGGQNIQAIMKKYSVFVKFTNAMELSAADRDFSDQTKVNNVICRTPARNAANLELVKSDIMEMVQQEDAEVVQEIVSVPRLLHRQLSSQIRILQDIERKWQCTITFPSTEMGSDDVVVRGPEWQVPSAVSEFLSYVPETHRISIPSSVELEQVLSSGDFTRHVNHRIKETFGIELLCPPKSECAKGQRQFIFAYMRSEAGGLKDAIEFLTDDLQKHGVNTDSLTAHIPRPVSDTFEETFPYFNSKLISGPVANSSASSSPATRPRNRHSSGSLGSLADLRDRAVIDDIEAAFNSGAGEVFNSFTSIGTNTMRKASNGSLSSSASSAGFASGPPSVHNGITPSSTPFHPNAPNSDFTPQTLGMPHSSSSSAGMGGLSGIETATRVAANYHHARKMMSGSSGGGSGRFSTSGSQVDLSGAPPLHGHRISASVGSMSGMFPGGLNHGHGGGGAKQVHVVGQVTAGPYFVPPRRYQHY